MKTLVIGVALALATAGLALADQPHMKNALTALQKARQELGAAKENKGGHRQRAIELVDKAIDQVQQGMDFAREK